MKKLIVSLMLVAGTTVAFAQGGINFYTFNANTSLGTCYLPASQGGGLVPSSFFGQLYWSDTSNGSFAALGSGTAFSSGAPGYVNFGSLTVPGRDNGVAVWFSMYVWDGASFANPGTAYGITQAKSRTLGGGFDSDSNFWPQSQYNNFVNLTLTAVPEPSVIALAGLGLASLLIFRRRK
jgi:hypothetical protein